MVVARHLLRPDGVAVASANEIRIPVGRDVVFTLQSADVIHSFWVPSLGGKVDMIPGRTTRLRVHATAPASFAAMRGILRRPACADGVAGHGDAGRRVRRVARTRSKAAPRQPAGETERRGQELFLASGCGACHAVRGTPAAGAIGPDLTHVGSRRSVGADTLPLDAGQSRALHRRRPAHQARQPDAGIPHLLRTTQRDALAAYLVSLR